MVDMTVVDMMEVIVVAVINDKMRDHHMNSKITCRRSLRQKFVFSLTDMMTEERISKLGRIKIEMKDLVDGSSSESRSCSVFYVARICLIYCI